MRLTSMDCAVTKFIRRQQKACWLLLFLTARDDTQDNLMCTGLTVGGDDTTSPKPSLTLECGSRHRAPFCAVRCSAAARAIRWGRPVNSRHTILKSTRTRLRFAANIRGAKDGNGPYRIQAAALPDGQRGPSTDCQAQRILDHGNTTEGDAAMPPK